MTLSPRFSWADPSAPDASKDEALYQSSTHISKQIDSMGISASFLFGGRRGRKTVKKKRELFPGLGQASRGSFTLPYCISPILVQEY